MKSLGHAWCLAWPMLFLAFMSLIAIPAIALDLSLSNATCDITALPVQSWLFIYTLFSMGSAILLLLLIPLLRCRAGSITLFHITSLCVPCQVCKVIWAILGTVIWQQAIYCTLDVGLFESFKAIVVIEWIILAVSGVLIAMAHYAQRYQIE